MRVAVSRDTALRAVSSKDSKRVFGIRRPAEGLVQVLTTRSAAGLFEHVGWIRSAEATNAPGARFEIDGAQYVVSVRDAAAVIGDVLVLSGMESLEDRRRGLVPSEGLGALRVDYVGAGSLGSKIALMLAEAGIGHHRVYDNSLLDTPNLSRHICDMADLGREKSLAVAEKLSLRGVDAAGATADMLKLTDDDFDSLLRGADLVVATTDSPAVQFVVNEAVVRAAIPAIFAGAYERARGGEVVVVRPGVGPCLYCAVGFRAGAAADLALSERRQAYQSANQNRLDAEPGLGIDIAYLASVAAAHALGVLDPSGCRAELARGGFTLVHGPSMPGDGYQGLFRSPLETIRARVVRDVPCPVCRHCSPIAEAS